MADDYKPIEKGNSQLIKRRSGRGRFLGPKTDLTSFDYSRVGKAHVDHIDNEYQTGFTGNRKEKDPTEFVDHSSRFGPGEQVDYTKRDIDSERGPNADANYEKLSADDGQLIQKKPGERYRNTKNDGGFLRGGAALKAERIVEDQERIGKFLTTPKGALFTIKQAILQNQNSDRETNVYNPLSLTTSLIDTLSTRPLRHINEVTSPFSSIGNFFRFLSGTNTTEQGRKNGNSISNNRSVENLKPDVDTFGGKVDNKSTNNFERNATITNDNNLARFPKLFDRGSKSKYEDESFEGGNKKANEFFNVKSEFSRTLQVRYGGRLGQTKKLDSNTELPEDFIKFRIRDVVNGRWIIFPAIFTAGITDNSAATYNSINYIGRPDAVHIYQNRTRSVSFGFRVVALNEEDIPIIWQKMNYLKGLTNPQFKEFFSDTEGQTRTNSTRPVAPIVNLTIGDMFVNTPGYFTSISVNVANSSTWETREGIQYPHVCDVSCEFTYIGKEVPTMLGENYSGFGDNVKPEASEQLQVRGLDSDINGQVNNILSKLTGADELQIRGLDTSFEDSPFLKPTLTKKQQRKADAERRRQLTKPFSRERRELRRQQKQTRKARYA